MTRELIAAIDIGGTKIAVALATTDGEQIFSERFLTDAAERSPHDVLNEALQRLERASGGERIAAVGCGCAGPLDLKRGLVLSPPNLPGWDEFPIVATISQKFAVPVVLDNDANAAALGELRYGAGRGLRDIVYITISTGIGGGIIIGGNLLHGVGWGAGEIGHITVASDDYLCGCGARGCLEAVCSGTAIARRAKLRLKRGEPSQLRSLVGDNKVTAETVAQAARDGDQLAVEIWEETIKFLSIGVGNVITILAPEAVIIGGGVALTGELLLLPLRAAVKERVRMLPVEQIQIVQAMLGSGSSLYGALVLAQSALAQCSNIKDN